MVLFAYEILDNKIASIIPFNCPEVAHCEPVREELMHMIIKGFHSMNIFYPYNYFLVVCVTVGIGCRRPTGFREKGFTTLRIYRY